MTRFMNSRFQTCKRFDVSQKRFQFEHLVSTSFSALSLDVFNFYHSIIFRDDFMDFVGEKTNPKAMKLSKIYLSRLLIDIAPTEKLSMGFRIDTILH